MYKAGDEVFIKGEIVEDSGTDGKHFRIAGIDGLPCLWFKEEELIPADKTYTQGLADAWELAKKIVMRVEDGGFDSQEVIDVFGKNRYYSFKDLTAAEALAKIEAYEKEKSVCVGDVVEDEEGTKALVIDEGLENTCFVFTENGCVEDWYKMDLKKTGKKISIGDLLRRIGE